MRPAAPRPARASGVRLALALLALAPAAAAQPVVDTLAPPPRGSLDERVFHLVYDREEPAFVGVIRPVNGASLPVFAAALPASALGTLVAGGDFDETIRLGASVAGTVGVVFLAKNMFRRARPYNALPGVLQRTAIPEHDADPYSFPSGHSAVAFALATSTSLSYPRWYVVAPAYAWATTTAVARVWFGVHYPTDILAGAAIGSGVAVLVHVLLPEVAPDDDDPFGPPPPPAITFRVGL